MSFFLEPVLLVYCGLAFLIATIYFNRLLLWLEGVWLEAVAGL